MSSVNKINVSFYGWTREKSSATSDDVDKNEGLSRERGHQPSKAFSSEASQDLEEGQMWTGGGGRQWMTGNRWRRGPDGFGDTGTLSQTSNKWSVVNFSGCAGNMTLTFNVVCVCAPAHIDCLIKLPSEKR